MADDLVLYICAFLLACTCLAHLHLLSVTCICLATSASLTTADQCLGCGADPAAACCYVLLLQAVSSMFSAAGCLAVWRAATSAQRAYMDLRCVKQESRMWLRMLKMLPPDATQNNGQRIGDAQAPALSFAVVTCWQPNCRHSQSLAHDSLPSCIFFLIRRSPCMAHMSVAA